MIDETFIELAGVGVTFGQGKEQTEALKPTNLSIEKGDFLALVGPSGCGKSTILRLVSELLEPTTGKILFSGNEMGAMPIRVGMAFQSASLLPWMSVRDNVMLPLKIVPPFKKNFRTKKGTEYRKRANTLLEQVGLEEFGDKNPWQLSGGMMQRANLCRALIHDPDMLLLDEPFGALDQFTREELWQTLQEVWLERKSTVILVTHDLREAVYLANRICVMGPRPGRIIEERNIAFARPRDIDLTFDTEFVRLVQSLRSLIVRQPNLKTLYLK